VRRKAGPLTFGQLSVLRYMQERIPDEVAHEANLSRLVEFPEGRSLDDIVSAAWAAVDRHESLRTTYRLSLGPDSVQEVRRPEEALVPVNDLGGLDPGELPDLAQGLAREQFDIEAEPGWRLHVITRRGRALRGCLVAHHMACDGWALRQLGTELSQPHAPGGPPDAAVMQPLDLARMQRSPAWLPRRTAVEANWARLLQGGLPIRYPKPTPGETGRSMAEVELGCDGHAVAHLAQRWGVLEQSVLLALDVLCICAVTHASRCVVSLMSSNRFDLSYRRLVTSMIQYAPMEVELQPDEAFGALVKRVNRIAIRAYPLGCYDVDEFARACLHTLGEPRQLDFVFNYLAEGAATRLPIPAIGDAQPQVHARSVPRRSGTRWSMMVLGTIGEPVVELGSVAALFPAHLTASVLASFAPCLRLSVTEPDVKVATLLSLLFTTPRAAPEHVAVDQCYQDDERAEGKPAGIAHSRHHP
jgi:hypothetical protein